MRGKERDAEEGKLAAFEIGAVNERGLIVSVATVGSAKLATSRFLDAREQYDHVWISDEFGRVVTFDELVRRAQEEDSNL